MIRLIVKGDALAAIQAAAKRDIRISVVRRMHDERETMLAAEDSSLRAVQAWMAETPGKPPYPKGALLFYNAIDATLQGRP